ncbi:unnamed protein product [Larinioides sclopetarius]|uniref:C2H2-type domain-containing protein n=1 Tax=Larinioides sclopetarius TaxID=280406 RepID=A0AAV2A0V6_9ARAC
MSRIGMRDSDGEGQSRDGNAAQHHQSSFGFENFEVTGQQRQKSRRGQLQRNDDEKKPENGKTFMCIQSGCPRTFSSRFKLVRHMQIHSGERRFQCTSCGRRFHRKDHLKNHLQVHNPNKIFHNCDLCQKAYRSLLSYRKHIALHAAESGDLVCKICGKMLPDKESILHHLKVHTGSRTLRGPSERKYPCDLCDRAFFTKKDVKRHLVVHTGNRDFVCQFCSVRFGRKDHLVRHTKKSHVNNSNSPPSLDPVRKYEPQTPQPVDSRKSSPLVVPSQMPDMPGLVISPATGSSMMDPPVMDQPIKPDPTYAIPPHTSVVQSNYSLNSLSGENGQGLGKYSEPTPLLPTSQYLPMSQSYAGVTPLMPHHYINMSSSGNILSDLLPPMSLPPAFTSLPLDVNNPPLPHFNQAFQ